MLLGACLLVAVLAAGRPAEAAPTLPPGFQDELVTPIDRPTAVAFVPGGRILIARFPGVVRLFKNGSLDPVATPALTISAKTCSDGERGLMSVAVDPQFESNHYIYLYYTFKNNGSTCPTGSSTSPVNRVSRFVLGDNDLIDPASEVVLIDGIPAPADYHIGADLQFGKDGYLYVSTGDGGCDWQGGGCLGANDASRDQNVLLGKVLRITRDGAIPASNPFQGAGTARCNVTGRTTAGNKCQETYAWGLRNAYRLAPDPNATGTRFFINDVGELKWEEIDLLTPGADYGWNVREGFCANNSTTNCGPPPAGMTNPIHAYSHDTGCATITGGTFIPKGYWPAAYDDDYIYADFACGKMFRLSPNGTGGYDQIEFGSGFPEYGVVTATFSAFQPKNGLYYAHWGETRSSFTASSTTAPIGPATRGPRPPRRCGSRSSRRSTRARRPTALTAPPLASRVVQPAGAVVAEPDDRHAGLERRGRQLQRVRYASRRCPAIRDAGPDEADVAINVSITDVRRTTAGLPDYTGQLQLRLPLRLTDRINGGPAGFEHGTLQDRNFDATVPCTGTASTTVGSTCTLVDDRRRHRSRSRGRGQADDVAARPDPGAGRRLRRRGVDHAELAVRDSGRDGSVGPDRRAVSAGARRLAR